MNKILIIGIPGSGKSTFSNKLGKILNREIIHLDKLYYRPGWVRVPKNEWHEIVNNLLLKDSWIMDGNYRGTLDNRLVDADTVIFLNFNKLLCIYRAFKRSFDKNQSFDKVAGDRNKISWDLIQKIITYDKNEIIRKLENYKNTKKIFIVRNDKELNELLKN